MNTCELLLETLSPEDWDAHVEGCPACRADVESFAALEGLGALVAEEPLPEGFAERLFARLESEAAAAPVVVRSIPTRRAPVRFGRTFLAAAASLLLILGGLLLVTPPAPPPALAPARLVVGLSGATPPAVAPSPSGVAEVVERSAALEPGSTLVTASGEGSSSVLTTGGDANQVRVGPDTELRVGRVDSTGAELQLSRGRVWVTEESVRMIVQTPHLTVIPLGTEYEAILDGDGTQVVVYEGSVRVVAADGTSKVLQADQEIAVGPAAPLAQAAPRQVRRERLREAWHVWNRELQLRGEPAARRPGRRQPALSGPRDVRPPQWLQDRWQQPGVEHPLDERLRKVREQAASGALDPETARRRERQIEQQRADLERWKQGWQTGNREDLERLLHEKEQQLRKLEESGRVAPEQLQRYRELLARKRRELERMGPDVGPGAAGGSVAEPRGEGPAADEPQGAGPSAGEPQGAGRREWLRRKRAELERFLDQKEAKLRELEASGRVDQATLRRYRELLARKRQELERLGREGSVPSERREPRGAGPREPVDPAGAGGREPVDPAGGREPVDPAGAGGREPLEPAGAGGREPLESGEPAGAPPGYESRPGVPDPGQEWTPVP